MKQSIVNTDDFLLEQANGVVLNSWRKRVIRGLETMKSHGSTDRPEYKYEQELLIKIDNKIKSLKS